LAEQRWRLEVVGREEKGLKTIVLKSGR